MLKVLVVCVSILAFPIGIFADPFLVCDPQAGVDSYEVFKDGALIAEPSAKQDGSLRYDLQGITPGSYVFTAKACEELWGCSDLSDPFVSAAPASKPTGLRMTRQSSIILQPIDKER